jgi:hypothetical protein
MWQEESMNKKDCDEPLQRPHGSNRREFFGTTSASALALFLGGPPSLLGIDSSYNSKFWGGHAACLARATAALAIDPTKEAHVGIEAISDAPKKTKVSRETFWVSKSKKEKAEWFCKRKEVEKKHVHGKDSQGKNSPCFIIVFDKDGCPFVSSVFISNDEGYASSDEVRPEVVPDDKKIYHYRVSANNKDTLDPGGGVKA